MKKVVFYGRYSSAMQTEQSIEGQLHVCEKYAEQNDLQIIGRYIDRAYSGTSDKRPQFQQMIADSENGRFEGILVYKLDRFARNRYDSAVYKRKLRERGIRVISATENITDTPEGIIMEGLLESMDEYYSAELGRKMKRGKMESFRKGNFIGHRAPFGYKIVAHKLAIDENYAPVVQEIFQRFADGERQNQILTDLNRRGIPNPLGRKWNKANICYMLQNPLYTGVYKVSDYGENPCPALVSQEIFERVQKMKQVSLDRSRKNKTNYDYILTGKMTCLQCGASVCGCSNQHGKYRYYWCHKHCGHRIDAEELHERVVNVLHKYLTPEKCDELAAAAFAAYQKEEKPATEQKLLEQEFSENAKKLENALKAVYAGNNSEYLKNSMQELENRQAEIQELLDNIAPPPPKFTEEHFRVALEMIIEKAQTNDLKQLLETVVNRIYVDDRKVIICINLTDEANTPPLEQVRFWVKSESLTLTQNHPSSQSIISASPHKISCPSLALT